MRLWTFLRVFMMASSLRGTYRMFSPLMSSSSMEYLKLGEGEVVVEEAGEDRR